MASVPQSRRTIAIPRLPTKNQGQHTTPARRRVARACTACRVQKVRCDGIKPECERCVTTQSNCDYVMPRKDRLKTMTELCRRSTELLRIYRDSASVEDQRIIDGIWTMFHEEATQPRTAISTPSSENDEMLESVQTSVLELKQEQVESRQSSEFRQEPEQRGTYPGPLPFYGGLPTVAPMIADDTHTYYATYGAYNDTITSTNLGVWDANSWWGDARYMEQP
ncbi:hypothetical protein HBI56_075330 [Parastagonospora nodorum]|uniref:Zn(2)-C6 fungal-type domain-containing protein n=2 Tax=Phaeosphaeria nodorum (strain SN15 / ATCC MYA-4574 / FGSC 10173) TaxID=321614 RepID=A0A7U2EWS5_PHANO|nr:hypothetical protein HBH56_169660 [Parastagonospora nodorum]QRC94382.1 hypothetical protein JI435_076250 [Parastagonospora nodorum SN15]KAH3928544.1 hypothetical protein HBH54_138210 [Parastagonospora nodorum]KAH3945379.1 hypothetical protein HBH53_143560 [Parastagonospora nodorum]KAH3983944.1 hypothetical protein HBH52_060660 [Parastagonospora nodorum]